MNEWEWQLLEDKTIVDQPGHRFFFSATEIEPLPPDQAHPATVTQEPRILIAGIGNIFLGDDGFGVEVAQRLSTREFPATVRVLDFGVRAFDLAYALQDGYETTILVDAYPHGQAPGTLSLVEPDINNLADQPPPSVDAHAMNLLSVLRMAAAMNGNLGEVLLVGCEPATLGGDEGQMGLSESVERAIEPAVEMIKSLVEKLLHAQP